MLLERRLAAITAVDVVGFSRLMAVDEEATWADWSDLRALIDPILERGGGRIVKSTGDGVLVESPSVIEAVRSAIDTQQSVRGWNATRPDDRQMRLRIGVNLGDVIIAEDGDVYGDGVNVAARLESLAPPGEVCISDQVHQQVKNRVDALFVDLGEKTVKNIPEPIRMWATGPAPDPARPPGPPRWLPVAIAGAVVALAAVAIVLAAGTDSDPTTTTTTGSTSSTEAAPTTEVDPSADASVFDWQVNYGATVEHLVVDASTDCSPTCRSVAFVALADGTVHAVDVESGESIWEVPFDVGSGSSRVVATEMAVDGGRLHLGRSEGDLLLSLDAATGRQVARTIAPFESLSGPRLGAAGGLVVVGHGLGVAAFTEDLQSDAEWQVAVGPVQSEIESVSVSGDLVAVTDGRRVASIRGADGVTRWVVGPPLVLDPVWILAEEVEVQGATGRAFERRVVVTTAAPDSDLLVLSDSGDLLWQPIPIRVRPGSPSAGVIVVGGVDGELVAIDVETGAEAWNAPGVRVDLPPVIDGDSVYVVDGTSIVEVNLRSGTERGRVDVTGVPTAIASLDGRVVVVLGDTVVGVSP